MKVIAQEGNQKYLLTHPGTDQLIKTRVSRWEKSRVRPALTVNPYSKLPKRNYTSNLASFKEANFLRIKIKQVQLQKCCQLVRVGKISFSRIRSYLKLSNRTIIKMTESASKMLLNFSVLFTVHHSLRRKWLDFTGFHKRDGQNKQRHVSTWYHGRCYLFYGPKNTFMAKNGFSTRLWTGS